MWILGNSYDLIVACLTSAMTCLIWRIAGTRLDLLHSHYCNLGLAWDLHVWLSPTCDFHLICLYCYDSFKKCGLNLILGPFRWHGFTPVRLSQCCKGWPENSQTGFIFGASSVQVQSLNLPSAMSSCVLPSSRCATTLTSIQVNRGSATSRRTWAVMPGLTTPREESSQNSRARRTRSLKGEGAETQDWHFVWPLINI